MPSDRDNIRVLIADRFAEARKDLCRQLLQADDMEIAGTARDGNEVSHFVRELKPDVILIDTNVIDTVGLTKIQNITEQNSAFKIIITSYTDQNMRPALLAGAKTYLIKPFSNDELFSSIRRLFGDNK